MMTQSIYFVAPRRIEIRPEAVPPPGPGQLLVQTTMSAISAGTEQLVYRGQVPRDLALDETISDLAGQFTFPFKYGYAVVGKVIDLGPGVAPEWQGRRVFAFHPHQSHFLSTPQNLLPLPPGVSEEDALFLPNMETAVNLTLDGQPLIGENVVVFGQGLVGLLTTALLARFPLNRLVTVDAFARRREVSLALGAQASVAPAAALAEYLPAAAGADLVFELSGNPAALDQAIAITGFAGRVIVGSWYGTKPAHLDLGSRFHRQRLRLISSQVSTLAPELGGRWSKARRLDVAWQMIRHVRPARFISHRFQFEQAAQAYHMLDESPELALQVVLVY
ncbi:MAG: Starvation-sensing protein RspB [Anaerolineae bacterium]|nr:Starvation-sensing protein RspB [Anaerolineae bacterium]